MLGFLVKAQQPAAVQRTNGSFTPIDPWLSVPKGINLTNVLPTYSTEPDYEIDLVPDIQKMTQTYPTLLDGMFQWFHDSAAFYNTKAIIQLGDITNWGTVAQFITASNAFHHIDSTGIPYAAVIGNHDYDSMAFVSANVVNRIVNNYNAYFGPSRYAGKPFYGGNYNNSNENFYIKFDAGSTKYMVIALEFLPRDSALVWAQRVLDSFPDRKTIIATHNYLSFYGEKSQDTSTYTTIEYGITGNAGQAMWDKLIKKNPQIVMVACGHQIHKVLFIPIVQRITEAGLYGNVVNQILTNYQDDTNGGNGYFMRITISPSTGKAYMRMFSPTLKQIDTRFPPFTLGYPETKINPVLGLSAKYGGLNVAGEARFDSSLFLTQLPLNHFVVTGKTGKLDTLAAQNPHKFLGGGITLSDTNAYFRKIDTTDLPTDSMKYVLNKKGTLTNTQSANFMINQPSAIISSLVGGGMPSLSNGGLPCMLQIVQPSGNWGLNICRPGNNSSNGYLSFYKTRGLTADSKVALQGGDNIGCITWQGVCADGSTVEEAGRFLFGVDTVLNTWPSGSIGIQFSSRGGPLSGTQFKFTSRGWLGVNTSNPTTFLDVNGTAIIRNYFTTSNNTSTWKPVVADTTGNIGIMTAPSPLVFTGTAAPATTPTNIGDIFVDTVNKKLYFATGTSSSADWTIANP